MSSQQTLLYWNYSTYLILGQEVNLISDIVNGRYNTVAEVEGKIHYLGEELDNITSAIFVWEELHSRSLTQEELRQVLKDNNIL